MLSLAFLRLYGRFTPVPRSLNTPLHNFAIFLPMPRKPCYWTRKLELELVDFVRNREFIWRPVGNTNHHIQQKYKAYAEFAASLGRGFTARSVRDRWVNIRSTFNHNLRRLDRSRETAQTPEDVYVPCWPLWRPLQFLRSLPKKDFEVMNSLPSESEFNKLNIQVKEEFPSDIEDTILTIRQRGQRTNRPRRRAAMSDNNKCRRVIEDLVRAMKPLNAEYFQTQSYWFFGKHVTERLNSMRDIDAKCASQAIMNILNNIEENEDIT